MGQNKVMAGKCQTPTAGNKATCAALKKYLAAQKTGFSKMKAAAAGFKGMKEVKRIADGGFTLDQMEMYFKNDPTGQAFWAENKDRWNKYAKSQGKPGFDFEAAPVATKIPGGEGWYGSLTAMASNVTAPITAAFFGASAYLASAIVPYAPWIAPYMPYVTGGLGLVALGGVAYGVKTMFFDGPKGPTKEEIVAAKKQQLAKLQQQKAEMEQKASAMKAQASAATQQVEPEAEDDSMLLYLGLFMIALGGCIAAAYVWSTMSSDEELVEDQYDIENPRPRDPIPVQQGVHFQSQPGPRKSIRNASKLPSGYNAEQHDRRVEI